MKTIGTLVVVLYSAVTVCSCTEDASRLDPVELAAQQQAEEEEARWPKFDLARATIRADGSPAAIVLGARMTAAAATRVTVEGVLRLDPDAGFEPHRVIVKIAGTKADGGKVTADSGVGRTEPVKGQKNVYRFRKVLDVPRRPGRYQVFGAFRGKTFSEGTLDVSM